MAKPPSKPGGKNVPPPKEWQVTCALLWWQEGQETEEVNREVMPTPNKKTPKKGNSTPNPKRSQKPSEKKVNEILKDWKENPKK